MYEDKFTAFTKGKQTNVILFKEACPQPLEISANVDDKYSERTAT